MFSVFLLLPALPAAAAVLVPMDDQQVDHLKAYGLAYWILQQEQRVDWLLNYRGGSFLVPEEFTGLLREASLRGVTVESATAADVAQIQATIAENNMESVKLEKAPRVAVYVPPNTLPWDDAVTLALTYAQIPYVSLWDEEVLRGDLAKYDWLHLHHEDFTAQYGKFWAGFRDAPWYHEQVDANEAVAKRLGFRKVTELKHAVARKIHAYVAAGGFMFAMCSATDTYDIALATENTDIAADIYDGDPADPAAQQKLDFTGTFAFRNFRLEMNPLIANTFSDIDCTQEVMLRGPDSYFTLFEFSAKQDPVPTMLTQDHVNAVPDFLGQSTAFRRRTLKPYVTVLASVENTDEVKYLHGQYGRGTFTFFGGHDPEDFQHQIYDPPTDLSLHKNSPGYRLILNNVLFPAAEKKKQKT
ncbi:MAG: asparagine synthetase B [Candidatus Eisenbacteria bacterium]|nr:asparagine synthetase B [Candidatus Eisenbacteria bacterium]